MLYWVSATNGHGGRERLAGAYASITSAHLAARQIDPARHPLVECDGYIIPSDGMVREMATLDTQERADIAIVDGGDVRRSPLNDCAWVQAWFRVDYQRTTD